jgi:hypothetical protein
MPFLPAEVANGDQLSTKSWSAIDVESQLASTV